MKTIHALGIDVSKYYLDVYLGGKYKRFSNSASGIKELINWLREFEGAVMAAVEATSSYHLGVCDALEEAGFEVHLFNPRQVRYLAKGLGFLSKTDKLDAQVLALCLEKVGSPWLRSSEAARSLKAISRQIQSLTDVRSTFKKQLQVCLCPVVQASLKRCIADLSKELRELEKQWLEVLKASPIHTRRFALLKSVPRIGEKTARVICSELPEDLSRFGRKQLAAYFGLVPRENQSGTKTGRSHIGHTGNSYLRKALFMPASLAMYRDPVCRIQAMKMLAEGKHHLQAVAASMHRLARRSIAVLLQDQPWQAPGVGLT
jgi:transposase